MNEEQAVLDFFANEKNLPLALAVADQMDKLRRDMNNRLWQELQKKISALVIEQGLAWQVVLTEEMNAADSLVGLQCNIEPDQGIFLRPMTEQQYLGREWRIYFGLMWSSAPSPDHLELPEVSSLKGMLQNDGFSSNAGFIAWQWTAFHPGRRDFLLRYAREPGKLLGELEAHLKKLLVDHSCSIRQANTALRSAPLSAEISLKQLHSKYRKI